MTTQAVRQDSFDVESIKDSLIGDRYLLEQIEVDQTTKSGIVLPGQTEDVTGWQLGRVIAVGNGHRLETDATVPMFFDEGDYVLCERFSGRRFIINGTTYIVMNQTSCFGKVQLSEHSG